MFSRTKLSILAAVFTLAALLAGCAGTGLDKPEPAAEPVATAEVEPFEGDIMQEPMDGSSMEAWERSMARVQAHATEAQYNGLQRAVQYHLTYDIGALKDMEKLVSRMNGKTPAEIISSVGWLRSRPSSSRKVPAPEATEPDSGN